MPEDIQHGLSPEWLRSTLIIMADKAAKDKLPPSGYADLLGEINTAPTGAAQWATAAMGDTGFFINWLAGGAQNDFVQLKTQVNHDVGIAQPIADMHVHYVLETQPAAGQTVRLETAWVWVPIGQSIPAISGWSTQVTTITFTGTETVQTSYAKALAANIQPPVGNTHSSILFIKILRRSTGANADTYTGDFGLLYLDCHAKRDRVGSETLYGE